MTIVLFIASLNFIILNFQVWGNQDPFLLQKKKPFITDLVIVAQDLRWITGPRSMVSANAQF